MYSKRRSRRAPGSIHAPCAFQLVFTMQNAEPHEAAALPATPAASAAISRLLFIIPLATRFKGDAPQRLAAERQLPTSQERTGGAREKRSEKGRGGARGIARSSGTATAGNSTVVSAAGPAMTTAGSTGHARSLPQVQKPP